MMLHVSWMGSFFSGYHHEWYHAECWRPPSLAIQKRVMQLREGEHCSVARVGPHVSYTWEDPPYPIVVCDAGHIMCLHAREQK